MSVHDAYSVGAFVNQRTVAVWGNHGPSFSTESELAWSFEHVGCKVLRFQEGETDPFVIIKTCRLEHADLLLYIHTHGSIQPGTEDVFAALRAAGTRLASFHLDRFWGLDAIDAREKCIGQHPLWKTDYVFTADGGNDAGFKERGVNHFWLPPAVVERGCYDAAFDPRYAFDVIFVGAKGYHPEYTFRTTLVDWLTNTYGARFAHFGGGDCGGQRLMNKGATIREGELNTLYASSKIAVGDSCFAGARNYWSDRVPETLGRGGFLIHPKTEGLNIPGLAVFNPADLNDLKEKIDYYLVHDAERIAMRNMATAHVRANDTYTQRVRTILQAVGL